MSAPGPATAIETLNSRANGSGDEKELELDELDGDFEDSEEEDKNVFKIRDALDLPKTNQYTARNLHSLIHEGLIDLNPEYQREVVWPESKMIHLIDSMFRNFYIPPIIFAVHKEDDDEIRVCVDGKQRLTSIQKFFDGQIPHRDSKTKKMFWYVRPESQKGSRLEIPDEFKKRFAEKTITCGNVLYFMAWQNLMLTRMVVEYRGILPGTEREIFQRVQLGMTLTGAEKLQAIASPWTTLISFLQDRHISSEGGLAHVLEWDTKRGRDFQCLGQFIYCCDGLPAQLIPTHQKMEKFLTRTDTPNPSFKTTINEVLDEFYFIATEKKLQDAFKRIEKRLAPVEFVFIGVLLYMLRNSTHESRAKAVYNLRAYVRREHVDIRSNTVVGKTMWHFISTVSENPTGSYTIPPHAPSTKTRKKRKVEDDSSGEEYRPTARGRASRKGY